MKNAGYAYHYAAGRSRKGRDHIGCSPCSGLVVCSRVCVGKGAIAPRVPAGASFLFHVLRCSGGLVGSKARGRSLSGSSKSSAAWWEDRNVSPHMAKRPKTLARDTLNRASGAWDTRGVSQHEGKGLSASVFAALSMTDPKGDAVPCTTVVHAGVVSAHWAPCRTSSAACCPSNCCRWMPRLGWRYSCHCCRLGCSG